MATMLMPPSSPAANERVLRIPPIAANLLPVEIVERRRGRRIRRLVLVAVILVIVLLGAWFAGTGYQTREARSDLARAEADAAAMMQQQGAFEVLLDTQAQSAKIKAQLGTLLASDLSWTKLLAGLRTSAPAGIRLTAVNGGLVDSVGTDVGKSGSGLPSASDAALIGKLTILGVGRDKATVATYLNAVGQLPGVANALLTGASEQKKPKTGVLFTVNVDITADALGGRYAVAKDADAGGS
jgi:hypothetical protein